MKDSNDQWHFEQEHLSKVISVAQKQLAAAKLKSNQDKENIVSMKKEQQENTRHSIANLWSMENFYELAALSQYESHILNKASSYEMQAGRIRTLEALINSPYFARIDFTFDGEDECEKMYIGRSSLTEDYEMHIYDWRSPVASVFYRFGPGRAFYEAPDGQITGELHLKRQYEIHNGTLEYFFDADIQIVDEFLRKMLSQNTSAKMKTIVETIQRDQDMIIRDQENDLLMVQGVAGSGKTSVALHRAAYLMYKGLSTHLNSENIMIISPNSLFENYISGVLPELGENNVTTVVFEDFCQTVLHGNHIQSRNQWIESALACHDDAHRHIMKRSMAFKTSSQFKEILDRFIADLPKNQIPFADVCYDGKCIASRQSLQAKILSQKSRLPLGVMLQKLESVLLEEVHEHRKDRIKKLEAFAATNPHHTLEVKAFARRLSIWESTNLITQIRKFTEIDIQRLYQTLFTDRAHFYRLADGITLPDCIEEIIQYTSEKLKDNGLPYEDAVAQTYLKLKTHSHNQYRYIKQVVVDEVQDYYPLHFAILHLLFPQSRYTILGDINQTIEKRESLALYDAIHTILQKEKATLVTMDKSFRCTNQIIAFSQRFMPGDCIVQSFSRNGDAPSVYSAQNQAELENLLVQEIINCREKGCRSMGLLCKTMQKASQLYDSLHGKIDIKLMQENSSTINGIFIMPVYLSKGLEFDAVLLCDCDAGSYYSEEDRHMLYVACTRALHRLNVFHIGPVSPLLAFLPDEI